jgi:1-acyl-sn-glycerol-3-phosphate acyltransferase
MRQESTSARLLWAPVNLVQAVYTALWTAFWISVALVATLLTRSTRVSLWLARRVWAPGLVRGAGARLAVRGLERVDPRRAHLYVANHSSWIDIPVLYMTAPPPLHFLAKQELATVPFLGWYLRAMGMVLVDRRDRRRASASVGRTAELLATGCSVVSFPEGTRSRSGALGGFRSGGFGAAIEAAVDVVPVAIRGAGDVLPPDGFRVRPGVIEVVFAEPIPAPAPGPGARAALACAAERAVRRALGADPDAAGTVEDPG